MEQLALKDMFSLEVLNWAVFRLMIQSALPHAPRDITDTITCAHLRGYDKTPAFNPFLKQTASTRAGVLGGKHRRWLKATQKQNNFCKS